MKFTIENFRWSKSDPFGDDAVVFDFDVKTDEEMPYEFPGFIQFSTLRQFLNETNPELVEYIAKVRSNIIGWGPKESLVLNELLGDEIDFEKLVYDLFERKGWFESEMERWKKLRSMPKEDHKQAVQFVEKIEKLAEQAKMDGPKNKYEFIESVDKAAHEIALRIYPEILDWGEEAAKEFTHLFQRELMGMDEKLDNFVWKHKHPDENKKIF